MQPQSLSPGVVDFWGLWVVWPWGRHPVVRIGASFKTETAVGLCHLAASTALSDSSGERETERERDRERAGVTSAALFYNNGSKNIFI